MIIMYPEENKKTFIEELQLLDEPIKRKILFVATGVAMIVVVFVWFGYFNGLVATTSQSTVAENQATADEGQVINNQAMINNQTVAMQTQAQGAPQNNIWQNMKIGTADMVGEFSGAIQWMIKTLQGPGQYNVGPSGK